MMPELANSLVTSISVCTHAYEQIVVLDAEICVIGERLQHDVYVLAR